MKTSASIVALAAMCAMAWPAAAQAEPDRPRPPKQCCDGSGKPWDGYNKGVRWEESLEAAKKRAAVEGKPILLYQLVGDLDKEGC